MAGSSENSSTGPSLSAFGHTLDRSPDRFAFMRPSTDIINDREALLQRLDQDGYLYFQDYLPREAVAAARLSILHKLQASDEPLFDDSKPLIDGVLSSGKYNGLHPDDRPASRGAEGDRRAADWNGILPPDLASRDPAIQRIVFGLEIASFYAFLFAEPVTHFDAIGSRLIGPGFGTPTHCDNGYMDRASAELLTCWIPFGDVPLGAGGLMVLEGSNQLSNKLEQYSSNEDDDYANDPEERTGVAAVGRRTHRGGLGDRPDLLPERFGRRWVTAREWKMGDFVTFKITTVYGGLDNRSDSLCISTETRWQPSAHPIDDRWVGKTRPATHSPGNAK